MGDLKEWLVGIKFYFKLGKMFTETSTMLKVAFVEHTVGRTQVFDWLSKFKSNVTSVEDADGLSEGTYSQKTEELLPMKLLILKTEELLPMKLLVLKNRRITAHEVANSQKQKNCYP